MREIKFRAFNGIDKTMISWGTIKAFSSVLINLINGQVKHHTLMQYTGLKDKNGVEIYEGDLIGNGESEENGTIYYCEKEAGFFINSNGFDFCLTEMDSSDSVIGNIHENPELLEQAA
jgi:hypothetical protein